MNNFELSIEDWKQENTTLWQRKLYSKHLHPLGLEEQREAEIVKIYKFGGGTPCSFDLQALPNSPGDSKGAPWGLAF